MNAQAFFISILLSLIFFSCEDLKQPRKTIAKRDIEVNTTGFDHTDKMKKVIFASFDKEYAKRRLQEAMLDTTSERLFTSSLTEEENTANGRRFYYTSEDGYYSMNEKGEIVYTAKRVWLKRDSLKNDTIPKVLSIAPSLDAETLTLPERSMTDSLGIPDQMLDLFLDNKD
jgi:hypothetical protein